jgi:hypothetical protein
LKPSRVAGAVAIVLAAGAALGGAYWFGAYSFAVNIWPATKFTSLRSALQEWWKPPGVEYGPYARLLAYPGKTAIPCPPRTDRTAVLLIFGQSNAANTGGERFASSSGRVAAYFDGKCSIAASPLLGTSGIAGEPWSAIGDRLVSNGSFDEVVLIPAAIGGSSLKQWMPGGELNSMLHQIVQDAERHYRITHVLWHQGESDFSVGTSEDAYVSGFQSLARDLRNWGVAAPIYVSVATRCQQTDEQWSADSPISRAQRRLGNSGEGFAPGVDTDALLTAIDRSDGCHIGGSGMAKVITAWTAILSRK